MHWSIRLVTDVCHSCARSRTETSFFLVETLPYVTLTIAPYSDGKTPADYTFAQIFSRGIRFPCLQHEFVILCSTVACVRGIGIKVKWNYEDIVVVSNMLLVCYKA